MGNEWQVPMHPAQREEDAGRRRRYLWGTVGGLVGLVANAIVLFVALIAPLLFGWAPEDDVAYASLGVIVFTGFTSVVLLIAGGLLCVARKLRPFGIGLLIGTAAGLICSNGICFAIVAGYS